MLRNIIRFTVFILVQVYVLIKVPHLHRFITPYLYYLFILWLPFSIPRFWLLVIGFITGLSLDYFTETPGLHAAACLLIAYIRPFVVNLLLPKDSTEFNYRSLLPAHWDGHLMRIYVLILTIFHHGYMLFLEWLSFGSLLDLSDQTCCHYRDKPFAHLYDGTFIPKKNEVQNKYCVKSLHKIFLNSVKKYFAL